MVGPLLGFATQLRTCDDGNLQLSREALQSARDIGDLLHTIFLIAALHQLQIVDDDQPQIVSRLQTTRLCPHFHNGDIWRIVDIYLRLGKGTHRLGDARPLGVFQESGAEAIRINGCFATQQSGDQLLLGHFEREDGDWNLVLD